MRTLRRAAGDGRRGWALLAVVFAAFLGVALTGVMMTASATGRRDEARHRARTAGWYLAEGATEAAEKQLVTAVANFQSPPHEGVVTIDGDDAAYVAEPTGFQAIRTDPSGIQTLVEGYRVEATAVVDGHVVPVRKIVNVEATPIFQFAVFYEGDLEIFPGPSMTLGGRVHTNADLYLGSGGTLTMDTNYVRAVGSIYRSRKDAPGASPGEVQIRQWVADPYDPSEPSSFVEMWSKGDLDAQGVPSASGYDSAFAGWDDDGDGSFDGPDDLPPFVLGALEYWSEPDGYGTPGQTVLTGAHGIDAAVPPSLGALAMFQPQEGGDYAWSEPDGAYVPVAPGTGTHAPGYYYDEADLVVVTHDDGSWDAYAADGTNVSGALAAAVSVEDLYDARQGGYVQVTTIDVDELNDSGVFPANGLLYAACEGAGEGTDAKGVQLTDGAELAGPLTVATPNPVYVHGDYNVDDKVGAAVLADAVNLLSNAWDGSKAPGTLPKADATTFNLAFVTGNHDTVGSGYNGGLENLPRFHENWTGVDCVLTGSFVNLGLSQHATGTWKYGGDRYTAPRRIWAYDPAFNDAANLPPYTPLAVTSAEVVTW